MGFSRQECWSGLPFPSGDLRDPEIKPVSSALAGRFFTTEPHGNPNLLYLYPLFLDSFFLPHEHWAACIFLVIFILKNTSNKLPYWKELFFLALGIFRNKDQVWTCLFQLTCGGCLGCLLWLTWAILLFLFLKYFIKKIKKIKYFIGV